MKPESLAARIRKAKKEVQVAEANFLRLRSTCQHEYAVQTSDYYEGSYSYDREDWHYGTRLCLICGSSDVGDNNNNFRIMKKAISRTPMDSELMKISKVYLKILDIPLKTALAEAEKGYKISCGATVQ